MVEHQTGAIDSFGQWFDAQTCIISLQIEAGILP
jgi:hypothetical protein